MPRFMLDTNIISYVLKRSHSPVAERYRRTPASEFAISSVVEMELRYGLGRMPKEANLHRIVEEALRSLNILPWDSRCAQECASVRTRLGLTGLPLSFADAMIAAHALALDLALVTADQAFERVHGLRFEDWTVGPHPS